MKKYRVVYEKFYTDEWHRKHELVEEWFFDTKEEGIKKIAEIKPLVYDKYKGSISRYFSNYSPLLYELVDIPECYLIMDTLHRERGACVEFRLLDETNL